MKKNIPSSWEFDFFYFLCVLFYILEQQKGKWNIRRENIGIVDHIIMIEMIWIIDNWEKNFVFLFI